MSLFDIAGDYRPRSDDRPARGIVAAAFAALRRPHDRETARSAPAEDPATARHRRREQGYLADIGI